MTVYAYDGHEPHIGHGCFVAPTAAVIGMVTLHDRASVWFSAVLRGDYEPISIGAGVVRRSGSKRVFYSSMRGNSVPTSPRAAPAFSCRVAGVQTTLASNESPSISSARSADAGIT